MILMNEMDGLMGSFQIWGMIMILTGCWCCFFGTSNGIEDGSWGLGWGTGIQDPRLEL